ncbi:hypothetical protein UFOVP140_23 [uncultured Caudovirales phage]|uniref:Uncharacterized protein n=1 Tax=uncultured Caudovirales phage TaxID=2100421 RepID=A0A6J5LEN7_9CAUD|nr:hypothetical protein UFOVP140_23 [uncultured Caudovirales phage]
MAAQWVARPGETLLIPSGPSGDHLFVIVLGPQQLPNYGLANQFIQVSVTTIYPGIPYDQACILNRGEHPFITHQSYVTYRHARIDSDAHLNKMVESGLWKPHDSCDKIILQKIINGLCQSKLVRQEIKILMGC